ncbi:hypothetical protein LL06_09820 [Hoeflea sp. BAL378]|uniref:hypothetical protein n=1 Tax=Hoeflea sp. BAL378 TaxID=1547437 RepID=UPI00051344DC|nr:hypothetical protein [Hoeflea sp. BAL378]KGF69618.1 hypothetical protein LL06_09820 [Hoeflea sp. BAL378]
MTTGPFRPDSSGSGKGGRPGSSSLLKLAAAAGLAIALSVSLTQLGDSRERVRCSAYPQAPGAVTLIAHAGGGLPQGDYSNSKEALAQSLAHGFELFELDFNWTADGELVIGHDWATEYRYWNRLEWGDWVASLLAAPSSRRYQEATPRFGLTRLSLDALLEWLRQNPGRIVTDFKTGNIEGLARIAERAPELRHRFVPQIYAVPEYRAVRALGFDDIIFTTYRLPPTAELFAEIDRFDLFAVTVPADDLATAAGVVSANRIFTHTINQPVPLPADGYYTDCLIPAKSPDPV